MSRTLAARAAVLGLACLWPAALRAQAGRPCALQLDSVGGVGRYIETAPGVVHQFAGGGVWASCRGQDTRLYTDSVAWYAERRRADFIGHFRFRDSTMILESRSGSYFLDDERLEAAGEVRLVNRQTSSRLQGPWLTYWRPAPGIRDTAELVAGDRPTVWYREAGDSGTEAYVIVAQQVRWRGDDRAWAGGQVTVDRSDFAARADSAELDMGGGRGRLIGHAALSGKGEDPYTLTGRTVAFRLADRQVSWVQAAGAAEATSRQWRLSADTIALDLAGRRVEQGTAWGTAARPAARSARYTMQADSLVMELPGQRLREMRGYGNALATARRDSLDGEPDWVAGDSLIARFDTTGTGPARLSELDARGRARAYYRVFADDQVTLAGINYSRGRRILASFNPAGVERVRVLGEGDGVYLEPVPKRP